MYFEKNVLIFVMQNYALFTALHSTALTLTMQSLLYFVRIIWQMKHIGRESERERKRAVQQKSQFTRATIESLKLQFFGEYKQIIN